MPATWLIRHAPTASNASEVFMGSIDVPAAEDGIERARTMAGQAGMGALGAVWVSPLRRARATAEAAFPDVELRVDGRLRERGLGSWEGVSKRELRRRHPDAFVVDGSMDLRCTPAGGEEIGALVARVHSFMLDLAADPSSRPAAVVSHNGVLRVMRYLLGTCGLEEASAVPEPFLSPKLVTWEPVALRSDALSAQQLRDAG